MKEVSYQYENASPALNGVSLTLDKGERVAVLGNNGAGKSTFFLCCNGVLKPNQGEIFFLGKPLRYKRKELLALRRKVGLVFQDADDQMIASTVEEEVSFGPMNLGLPKEVVQEKVDQSIQYMELDALRKRPPHYLSGGEKKRVSIADIIAMDSEIILFDEPTASLDPENTALLKKTLNRLSEQGKTLVVSTHDIDFAWDWADRVLVFHAGNLLMEGSPEEVFAQEDLLEKAGIRRPILYDAVHLLVKKGLVTLPFHLPKGLEEFEKLLNHKNYFEERRKLPMKGILVVSFGTSYDKARACIDAVESSIENSFPNYVIRRAFTSGMIIKKLAERGIYVDTVSEALGKLASEGVKELIVQPTHLIAGIEYEKLLDAVSVSQELFHSVKIGAPLLANESDQKELVAIIEKEIKRQEGECLVLMGHGSEHEANGVYTKLQELFFKQGNLEVFVGTVEGTPNGEDVLKNVKKRYKKAVMAPLMLVAGDHALHDMAGEEDSWKTMFEEEGIEVRTILKGLGTYQGVLEMYVKHVKQVAKR